MDTTAALTDPPASTGMAATPTLSAELAPKLCTVVDVESSTTEEVTPESTNVGQHEKSLDDEARTHSPGCKSFDANIEAQDVKHDVNDKESDQFAPSLRFSSARRGKILDEVYHKTGRITSAVEAFLDHAEAIGLILTSISKEEPQPVKSIKKGSREIAIPEIKRMSWEEWNDTERPERMGVRIGHHAIDVLHGEPWPRRRNTRSYLVGGSTPKSGTGVDTQEGFHNDENGSVLPTASLPARIRINSAPAKRLLDSICNDELDFASIDALVIARPYKVLTLHRDKIHERLAQIEQMYKERLEKLASVKPVLDHEAGTGEQRKDAAHSGAAGDDSKHEVSDEEAVRLAERQFPTLGIFSTGTDWSQLTLSEINEAVADFRCLVRFMDESLRPVQTYLGNSPSSINFNNIWHLFPTGCLVYCKEKSTPQKIWRVIQATGGRKYMAAPLNKIEDWENKFSPFVVDCYYLDFDGVQYVRVYRRFKIDMFEETIPIVSLQIMPLVIAEKSLANIDRDELCKKGKRFLNYTRPQHRYYQGTTVTETPGGEPLFSRLQDDGGAHRVFTERVESQVMVDFERGTQANPGWGPANAEADLWRFDQAELLDGIEVVEKDQIWDARTSEEFLKVEETKRQEWNKGGAAPEGNDLLLLPNRVLGYVLRTRSWACLRLADDSGKELLTHVGRQTDTWQDLELPDGHKSIVQALINTHFSKNKTRDAQLDLVREKGKGVILLLHGVPGVGKTATAECVAASHGKPLLPITCGDLGLKPKEVESTLQTAFQLAQAWDCVMLLDEADIFLAQRTNKDIERNALVSVFLRILEYYEGILFLTTNRIGVFDEAFKSRIHMALYYPPLKWPTTEKIWENLIRRAFESSKTVTCNHDALMYFARQLYDEQDKSDKKSDPTWNGRQIRNAFQSALALACNEINDPKASVTVEPRHFKTVAKVSSEFNQYIFEVKSSQTDAEMNRLAQIRADSWHAQAGVNQSQPSQFAPPVQTVMPLRQATPFTNHFQAFPTPQGVYQQANHTTGAGWSQHPSQPIAYNTAHAPFQPDPSSAYGPQKPQYTQHLQAPLGPQYQTPQASSGQQYQIPQGMTGQQYQAAQGQAPYSTQYTPASQTNYAAGGAVDQTGAPQQKGASGQPQ